MSSGDLGRVYEDGETIVRQGEVGDTMFVIQEGFANVIQDKDGCSVLLRTCGPGEVIGEMAIFEKQPRSATVQAKGRARVLTLDKRTFLQRLNEDPSLAFQLIQTMSRRVRELSEEVAQLRRET